MKELSWNYYDALSPEVVDSILEICLNEKLVDGEVGQSDMSYLVDSKVRKSKIALLDKQKHAQIFNLMFGYVLDCNRYAYGFDIDQIENCQFSVYDSDNKDFYDWHFDTQWGNSTLVDRKISLVVQLSDRTDYEGGAFEIENVTYSPKDKIKMQNKGAIITFPSFLNHRVTPVTKGKRMSLIVWAEGKNFR